MAINVPRRRVFIAVGSWVDFVGLFYVSGMLLVKGAIICDQHIVVCSLAALWSSIHAVELLIQPSYFTHALYYNQSDIGKLLTMYSICCFWNFYDVCYFILIFVVNILSLLTHVISFLWCFVYVETTACIFKIWYSGSTEYIAATCVLNMPLNPDHQSILILHIIYKLQD